MRVGMDVPSLTGICMSCSFHVGGFGSVDLTKADELYRWRPLLNVVRKRATVARVGTGSGGGGPVFANSCACQSWGGNRSVRDTIYLLQLWMKLVHVRP
jgi:hypothetical protein